jgi:hypothetical protein
MEYEISLSEDRTYVRIRVFKAITGELEKEFAGNAIRDAKERQIHKYLVDVRGTPNIATSSEQYFFGHKEMDQLGLDRGSRIAVLVDAEDSSHDFVETVFVNAGFACRIFRDNDAALKWLAE